MLDLADVIIAIFVGVAVVVIAMIGKGMLSEKDSDKDINGNIDLATSKKDDVDIFSKLDEVMDRKAESVRRPIEGISIIRSIINNTLTLSEMVQYHKKNGPFKPLNYFLKPTTEILISKYPWINMFNSSDEPLMLLYKRIKNDGVIPENIDLYAKAILEYGNPIDGPDGKYSLTSLLRTIEYGTSATSRLPENIYFELDNYYIIFGSPGHVLTPKVSVVDEEEIVTEDIADKDKQKSKQRDSSMPVVQFGD